MVHLQKEFEYYLQNQDELLEKYEGRYIVVKDDVVLGAFDTEMDALREISKKYELGTFLVQKCDWGDASYTQTYHSRVAIV